MKLERPTIPPAAPDWRVGCCLLEVLEDHVIWSLSDDQQQTAARVTVTAISYSPKRRQYQIATRGSDGRGATGHFAERDIRRRPA